MVAVESPVIDPCGNTFLTHDGVELPGALAELILPASLPDADDDSGVPVKLHIRMIERHVAKEDSR